MAREHVSRKGTLAREEVGTQGTLALEQIFSTQGRQFSRLALISRNQRSKQANFADIQFLLNYALFS